MASTPVRIVKRDEYGNFVETGNEVVLASDGNTVQLDTSLTGAIPTSLTDGINDLVINPDGSINVQSSAGTTVSLNNLGSVDENNSTQTPLVANNSFTGLATDTLNYSVIIISVFADQPSDENGLTFQFSSDSLTWYSIDHYTYQNNGIRKTYTLQTVDRYFRILYTNGNQDQTEFDLAVTLKQISGVESSHRIEDVLLNGEDDASLVKSIISARTPRGQYHNVTSDSQGNLNVNVLSPVGVLPVSQLTTLRDGKILNRFFPELDEIVGTHTGTHQGNKYNMAVTAGQWGVYHSRRFYEYYSGKPQKVEFTFDKFAPQANVIKRVGYFSSNTVSPYDSNYDGLWLESGNGTITLKAMRAGVETISADIADWSNSGELKEYADLATWDNFTVCEINFLWLGGAYIELRLVTSSGFTTVHQIVYAGTSQDVFIESPNQTMRYEIRSTTGEGEFRYICNQIATSGSINESGLGKAIHSGTTITFALAGTKYPILAIKKQEALRRNYVSVRNVDLLVTSNDIIYWSLEINPTLSVALTYAPVVDSNIEMAIGDGAITVDTDGIVIANGFLLQGENVDAAAFQQNFLTSLSGSIDGTQDEYVICVRPVSSQVGALATMGYLEG